MQRFLAEWSAAIVTNDPEAIATFVMPDWVLVTPEAGIVGRDQFLDAVRSGRLRHDTMHHDVLRVRSHGDVLVVTTRERNTGCFLGQRLDADEWTTDVVVRDDGRWRCALTHLTPVSRPEP
jgi:uncharacterized protein (TIGR02246 family)